MRDNKVLHQEEDFLVVEKCSGDIALRCSVSRGKPTLQEWLELNVFPKGFFRSGIDEFSKRAGIVHRLDKDTSGLVLVAKNPSSFKALQDQFRRRLIKKRYLALVVGDIPFKGTVLAPVKRMARSSMKYTVAPGGKRAKTDYFVLEKFKLNGEEYSYLEAFPLTGRTHQIRVHLRYLGHPILGDPLYGFKTKLVSPRLFLHASAIDFFHPVNNNQIGFKSSLPEELQAILFNFRQNHINDKRKTEKRKKIVLKD